MELRIKCKKAKTKLADMKIDLSKRGGPELLHRVLLQANPAVESWSYDFAEDVIRVVIPDEIINVGILPFAAFGEVEVVKEDAP